MARKRDTSKGHSLLAYAEHRRSRGLPGGTKYAVQKALKAGRIVKNRHGKIDPEIADKMWAANTTPQAQHAAPKNPDALLSGDDPTGVIPPYTESRAAREYWEAELKRQQVEKEAGRLVSRDEVRSDGFELGRKIQARILSLPDRHASDFVRLKSKRDARRILDTILRSALLDLDRLIEEASDDGA